MNAFNESDGALPKMASVRGTLAAPGRRTPAESSGAGAACMSCSSALALWPGCRESSAATSCDGALDGADHLAVGELLGDEGDRPTALRRLPHLHLDHRHALDARDPVVALGLGVGPGHRPPHAVEHRFLCRGATDRGEFGGGRTRRGRLGGVRHRHRRPSRPGRSGSPIGSGRTRHGSALDPKCGLGWGRGAPPGAGRQGPARSLASAWRRAGRSAPAQWLSPQPRPMAPTTLAAQAAARSRWARREIRSTWVAEIWVYGTGTDAAGGGGHEEGGGAIAQGGDRVALGAAEATPGQVMLDLHALRPAQGLVEVRVQFLFGDVARRVRIVQHGSASVPVPSGRVPRSAASGPGPASCQPHRRRVRTARQFRDS